MTQLAQWMKFSTMSVYAAWFSPPLLTHNHQRHWNPPSALLTVNEQKALQQPSCSFSFFLSEAPCSDSLFTSNTRWIIVKTKCSRNIFLPTTALHRLTHNHFQIFQRQSVCRAPPGMSKTSVSALGDVTKGTMSSTNSLSKLNPTNSKSHQYEEGSIKISSNDWWKFSFFVCWFTLSIG